MPPWTLRCPAVLDKYSTKLPVVTGSGSAKKALRQGPQKAKHVEVCWIVHRLFSSEGGARVQCFVHRMGVRMRALSTVVERCMCAWMCACAHPQVLSCTLQVCWASKSHSLHIRVAHIDRHCLDWL